MPDHTPGPWQPNADSRYNGGDPIIIWGPKGPGFGAVAYAFRPGLSVPDAQEEEVAANARIIAAAPSLLDALQLLYDAQSGPPLLAPRNVQFWEKAMAAANAALAKAKGKEPADA